MYKIIGLLVLTFALSVNAIDGFKIVSMGELDKMLSQKEKQVYLFDANVESTRENVGIIPGAKLVNSSETYDLKKDLPADLNSVLVFYCANTRCTASHLAANKALRLGYKNVSVMSDGIYGWQKAGKKLERVSTLADDKKIIPKEANEVTPQEAQSLVLKKQGIIVDVREAEERHSMIEGALWFPLSKANDDQAWAKFVSSLPKGKQVIFHCAAGFRSKKLAERLSSEGRSAVYFKGTDQWSEAGLPLKISPHK